MKKIEYKNGDVIGNYGVIFVRDLPPSADSSGRMRRFAIFMCHCGKEFESRVGDIKPGRTRTCKCTRGNSPKKYNYGDIINGVKFIRTLGTVKQSQRAIFECPVCAREWDSLVGNITHGSSKSCCQPKLWSKNRMCAKYDKMLIYKVLMFDNNERFVKIGIASKERIDKRLKELNKSYKHIVLLKTIEGDTGHIIDLEQRLHRVFKKYKYSPSVYFRGHTECFKY